MKMQEQLIEHLRREVRDLRLELEDERTRHKETSTQLERELKTAQRHADEFIRTRTHLEVRAECSERDAREANAALQEARKAAHHAESESVRIAKDAECRLQQLQERINRLENEKAMALEECEKFKTCLESEKCAIAELVRQHAAELKGLHEEHRTKMLLANKELQERSLRELEDSKNVRIESEKIQKIMEQDFRAALAEKEEELRQARANAKAIQKSLEEQIRESVKSTMTHGLLASNSEADLVRSLKHEIEILKNRNKKLEKNIQAAGDSVVEATNRERTRGEALLAGRDREIRHEVQKLLQSLKSKDMIIIKQAKQMDNLSNVLTKIRNRCANLSQNADVKIKMKPQLPLKSAKVLERKTIALNRDNHSHVKDIVRQLQEKECETKKRPPLQLRIPNNQNLNNIRSTSKTIEDLKAIDADIEKLRRQIEDRDRVISRLREETRTKDEQLQNMMIINRKHEADENGVVMCTSPDASESSGSDGNSPIPSDAISYLDFINQPKTTKNDNDKDENQNTSCTCQTLMQEVKKLRERETALLTEAALLREQNDLMEFRILELEECQQDVQVNSVWRDHDNVSDSGVMSLPTSEDLTSDSDQGDGNIHTPPIVEIKLTGVATVFPSVQHKKSLDCLQESGIFEDGDISQSGSTHSDCTALFRCTDEKSCQTSKIPELSTEIWKLSEIQKRIQLESKSPYAFCVTDYITFYEERLLQLQEKLSIYESTGDCRNRLLNKRLDKEIALAAEIRNLKEIIVKLKERNLILEEERCEFEEAENDSRLQCQRLEFQLVELTATKEQLEMEYEKLQQDAMDRNGNANLMNKIFKLQAKVEEFNQQSCRDQEMLRNLELQLEEKEEKMGALLKLKLDVNAADAKIITRELGLDDDFESGNDLRKRIESLEKTNQAFIKALSDSDQIWATQEEEYKNQINQLEKIHMEKMEQSDNEIKQLKEFVEEILEKLTISEKKLLKLENVEETLDGLKLQLHKFSQEILTKDEKIRLLEFDNAALVEKINDVRFRVENEQREKQLEQKILELNEELTIKNKQLSDLEVTTSELKEEVETLETLKSVSNSSSVISVAVSPSLAAADEKIFLLIKQLQDLTMNSQKSKKYEILDTDKFIENVQKPFKNVIPFKKDKKMMETQLKNHDYFLDFIEIEKKGSHDVDDLDTSDSDWINSNYDLTFSSAFQVASDNLPKKCRQATKKAIIKPHELQNPKKLQQEALETDSLCEMYNQPPVFKFAIVKIEKINPTSLFLAWDFENVPDSVEGYSIFVNDCECVVVRGRNRNRAILKNLDLSKSCLIAVNPISCNEKFSVKAIASYYPK